MTNLFFSIVDRSFNAWTKICHRTVCHHHDYLFPSLWRLIAQTRRLDWPTWKPDQGLQVHVFQMGDGNFAWKGCALGSNFLVLVVMLGVRDPKSLVTTLLVGGLRVPCGWIPVLCVPPEATVFWPIRVCEQAIGGGGASFSHALNIFIVHSTVVRDACNEPACIACATTESLSSCSSIATRTVSFSIAWGAFVPDKFQFAVFPIRGMSLVDCGNTMLSR